jgi:hypothetical protein
MHGDEECIQMLLFKSEKRKLLGMRRNRWDNNIKIDLRVI